MSPLKVAAVLGETGSLIVAKHGVPAETQAAYVAKILKRFANPYLPDTTLRVGRAPLRKLSRNDRFISPAAQLAERGLDRSALIEAIGAGLRFDPPDDPEAVELQQLLRSASADEVTRKVTGLSPDHPLYADVVAVVEAHQNG